MSCSTKLLLYCVAHSSGLEAPVSGVMGMPVQSFELDDISLIYSPLIPPQEFTREDALSFHSVLKTIFQRQAIIPFRFPTLLQNGAELQTHLREKYQTFSADLVRLQDLVQMELRIPVNQQAAAPAKSGTEYLRTRQQESRTVHAALQEARTAAGEMVLEWKERPTESGLRCYALIKREHETGFRRKIEAAHFGVTGSILLSGPWPATEFLHE